MKNFYLHLITSNELTLRRMIGIILLWSSR